MRLIETLLQNGNIIQSPINESRIIESAISKREIKMKLNPIVRRLVEDAGGLTQSLGSGRVIGQIYALLYFSREPANLSQMQEALGISKGSASTGVRQLEQWGAVRKVWVKGDRKDYYSANDWLGGVVRSALSDMIGRKLGAFSSLLNSIESQLSAEPGGDGDEKYVRERIGKLKKFQKNAERMWNNRLIRKLLEQ